MTPEEIAAELERLKRLLAARENKSGFTANVALIKSCIAILETQSE